MRTILLMAGMGLTQFAMKSMQSEVTQLGHFRFTPCFQCQPDERRVNHFRGIKLSPTPTSFSCQLVDRCSGCDRLVINGEKIDRPRLEADRRLELTRLGLDEVPVSFRWIDACGLRDRLEFTLEPNSPTATNIANMNHSRFGLFDRERTTIVDIAECPQLSLALQAWLTDFRRDLPTVPARRSVRLRVAPSGQRGVWLDFANEDIRDLLDDGEWLERQIKNQVIVEVGQKRKRVVANSSGPRLHRLQDATLDAWFETPIGDLSATIFGTIGTFTQPGFRAARTLVKTVLEHAFDTQNPVQQSGVKIAEFGSGNGSLTIPLLATGAEVNAFESDRLAIAALELGLKNSGLDSTRLKIYPGDFILSARAIHSIDFGKTQFDIVIVDPPRPGLGVFIDSIVSRASSAKWIYVSCYPESFAKDALALKARGLNLKKLSIVEQFPFTRHFEIVATFE